MRQFAGSLNRGWLAVIGVVLILAGVAGGLATTGVLGQILTAAGTGVTGPVVNTTAVGNAAGLLDQPFAAIVVALIGLLLGVLGLAWLLAQIPRTNAARPFRLHDATISGTAGDLAGLTVCAPGVLAEAVEADIKSYPGVDNASAVLRGTARAPELTVHVTADDRTDLRQLLTAIQQHAAANLARAMDTPLAHLAVQLDINRGRRATKQATV